MNDMFYVMNDTKTTYFMQNAILLRNKNMVKITNYSNLISYEKNLNLCILTNATFQQQRHKSIIITILLCTNKQKQGAVHIVVTTPCFYFNIIS